MREILFKAKRKDNGEWVEGYYVKTKLGKDIKPSDVLFVPFNVSRNEEWGWVKVIPDTLCQFTGLTDKNGRKIWENDIVNTFEEPSKSFLRNVIKFEEGCFKAFAKCYLPMYLDNYKKSDFEVTGNIFDNPELLEG